MKKLIALVLVVLGLNAFGQMDNVKSHTISLETGLWDRGVTGIGYNYNFLKTENTFVSIHASAGVGLLFVNEYYTIAPSLNIGKKNAFITIGAQYKYTDHYYLKWRDFLTETGDYEGSGFGSFIGFNIFSEAGFNFKGRISATYLTNAGERMSLMPGAGLSFGYSFGK